MRCSGGGGAGPALDPAPAALRSFLDASQRAAGRRRGALAVEEAQLQLQSDLVAAAEGPYAGGVVPPLPAELLEALVGLMRSRDLAEAQWGAAGAGTLVKAVGLGPELSAITSQALQVEGMPAALAACVARFVGAGHEPQGEPLLTTMRALYMAVIHGEAAAAEEVLGAAGAGGDAVGALLDAAERSAAAAGGAVVNDDAVMAATVALGTLARLMEHAAPARRRQAAARCAAGGALGLALRLVAAHPDPEEAPAVFCLKFVEALTLASLGEGATFKLAADAAAAEQLAGAAGDLLLTAAGPAAGPADRDPALQTLPIVSLVGKLLEEAPSAAASLAGRRPRVVAALLRLMGDMDARVRSNARAAVMSVDAAAPRSALEPLPVLPAVVALLRREGAAIAAAEGGGGSAGVDGGSCGAPQPLDCGSGCNGGSIGGGGGARWSGGGGGDGDGGTSSSGGGSGSRGSSDGGGSRGSSGGGAGTSDAEGVSCVLAPPQAANVRCGCQLAARHIAQCGGPMNARAAALARLLAAAPDAVTAIAFDLEVLPRRALPELRAAPPSTAGTVVGMLAMHAPLADLRATLARPRMVAAMARALERLLLLAAEDPAAAEHNCLSTLVMALVTTIKRQQQEAEQHPEREQRRRQQQQQPAPPGGAVASAALAAAPGLCAALRAYLGRPRLAGEAAEGAAASRGGGGGKGPAPRGAQQQPDAMACMATAMTRHQAQKLLQLLEGTAAEGAAAQLQELTLGPAAPTAAAAPAAAAAAAAAPAAPAAAAAAAAGAAAGAAAAAAQEPAAAAATAAQSQRGQQQQQQTGAGSMLQGSAPVCLHCGKTAQEAGMRRLRLCRGCLLARFCSVACYNAAWRGGHEAACKAAAAARAATGGAGGSS